MGLRFYNTYTKRVQDFEPLDPPNVRMYNCGPTVYSHPHIGNFRAFIFADLLRRYLEYRGYRVTQVMNITDVGHLTMDDIEAGEDKIQQAARMEKKDPWQIAEFYTQEFFELVRLLGLKEASVYPRATQHIPEQIALATKLVEKGFAYEAGGNLYFEVQRFPKYGQLSGNTLQNLIAGARVQIDPNKRNPIDFALWKRDPGHIMQWDSPWGKGFPGWHLECSAMAMKYLGETIDIHTGGEDNIFPHHESEIAQSEAASGKQFVRYWLHVRHLFVEGKKMSKSEGNFYTVRDVLEKGYSPMALRYLLLSANYRQHLNFTFDALRGASLAVERLEGFKRRLELYVPRGGPQPSEAERLVRTAKGDFIEALDEDINISAGLGVVFEFIREVHKLLDQGISARDVERIKETFEGFSNVLGIRLEGGLPELDQESRQLIHQREEARRQRDFPRADRIRELLRAKGIVLEDTPEGTRWRRVSP